MCLRDRGITFTELEAPFVIDEDSIQLEEAKASGPALGVTVSGEFSLQDENVDVQGVLVPAYTFNAVLGEIPILGDLFVSRDGEGVIGLTYSVEGPFNATRVFVNPLSALTPGVFRRIFEGSDATSDNASEQPQTDSTTGLVDEVPVQRPAEPEF